MKAFGIFKLTLAALLLASASSRAQTYTFEVFKYATFKYDQVVDNDWVDVVEWTPVLMYADIDFDNNVFTLRHGVESDKYVFDTQEDNLSDEETAIVEAEAFDLKKGMKCRISLVTKDYRNLMICITRAYNGYYYTRVCYMMHKI